MVRAPPCHGGSCEFESRQSRLKNFISKFNNNIMNIIIKIEIYSPCTFNKANPNERPNKVIKKHIAAMLTISGLAYGKICLINSIIFYKEFK
jgi:hypothetical protein